MKSFWDFGREVYSNEFEVLFTDLTIDRAASCEWIMTQIMIMHIQASQCEALQEEYKVTLATAETLLSGNETEYASTVSSLTSTMNGYDLLVSSFTKEQIYDMDEYYSLVEQESELQSEYDTLFAETVDVQGQF